MHVSAYGSYFTAKLDILFALPFSPENLFYRIAYRQLNGFAKFKMHLFVCRQHDPRNKMNDDSFGLKTTTASAVSVLGKLSALLLVY